MICPAVKPKNREALYKKREGVKVLKLLATATAWLKRSTLPVRIPAPRKHIDDSVNGSSGCTTTYYLLKNLEVVSHIEYWEMHWKTRGNHSPAIKSSTDKNAFLELSKKLKYDRMDSIT